MDTYRIVGIMWIVCGAIIPSTPLLILGFVFLVLSLND